MARRRRVGILIFDLANDLFYFNIPPGQYYFMYIYLHDLASDLSFAANSYIVDGLMDGWMWVGLVF